ncbi:MAG TPA: VCBS repeat-containing protein, partial [Planctomycetota bacterium]|nr:VCBS repeat-containing protein [Planctomycetota bacterium]
AKLDGPVRAASPVDLVGDGTLTLHLACETGDRLFRYDAKTRKVVDVTVAAKLAAKSACAAWGDFNADGRMDLVSFDGASLVVHTQDADGTFRPGPTLPKTALPDGCLSLTCIDSGKPGRPCVVIGTKRSPRVWTPGDPESVAPVGGDFAGATLGAPGTCLVADFDGDAVPDLMQLFEKGSLVYRGTAPGRFGTPVRCAPALGTGVTNAFLGDWDADGLLDVFTLSSEGSSGLWDNRGRLAFVNTMTMTGELSYKGARGATSGMTGDFNNDGRQDVFFCYAQAPPRLYFNRGFRSFGLTNGMDVVENNMLPAAKDGQQAGCFIDLEGDGAQDVVLVLANGEAWALHVEAVEGAAHCVRGVLSSKGAFVGPLTVTGWQDKRCLGAWNVLAGTSEALFARTEPGPVTLEWRAPASRPDGTRGPGGSGELQRKKVLLENRPLRIVLSP